MKKAGPSGARRHSGGDHLLGLGAIPGTHPSTPALMWQPCRQHGGAACRLVLAIGARFDDRATGRRDFAPHARIGHIDIDPAEIGKNVRVDIPIVGDARRVLRQILANLTPGSTGAWQEVVDGYRKDLPYPAARSGVLTQQGTVEALCRRVRGKAILATDVGLHQMFVARHIPFDRPRNLLSSGGLGTMGYGLPAAMGAAFARPGELVVAVCGDGSFLMNLQELATVAEHALPLKVIVLNNRNLGMVRQFQHLYFNGNYTAVDQPTHLDFALVARGLGVASGYVADAQRLEGALTGRSPAAPTCWRWKPTWLRSACRWSPGAVSEMTYGSTPPPTALLAKLSQTRRRRRECARGGYRAITPIAGH